MIENAHALFGSLHQLSRFADMLEAGILDPTKVTRLALQNAASVAGLLLTTEVMIADGPKDDAHAGGGMPRGGMAGMDM